jgi:hypothetical protein
MSPGGVGVVARLVEQLIPCAVAPRGPSCVGLHPGCRPRRRRRRLAGTYPACADQAYHGWHGEERVPSRLCAPVAT